MTLDELAPKILARCGRRCCICRRFRPVMLQVHHIKLKSQGGKDEEDNLIAVCITCHIDVHSKVPFARRFTVEELKLHRDHVYKLVENGKLVPPPGADSTRIAIAEDFQSEIPEFSSLPSSSIEMLLSAVESGSGVIIHDVHLGSTNHREVAAEKHGIRKLEEAGFVEEVNDSIFRVTHEGYLCADALLAEEASRGKKAERKKPKKSLPK